MAARGIDFTYKAYKNFVKSRLTAKGIAATVTEKSTRYPDRFEGTTIITDPNSSAHVGAYQILKNYQGQISEGKHWLMPTPVSSFHMTLLGITHMQLQKNSVESGNLPKIINRVNELFGGLKLGMVPRFKIGGFALLPDAVVTPLFPVNYESYESLINIRNVLLGDPDLRSYGITSGPVMFHITTHYIVKDKIDRLKLNAALNDANEDLLFKNPILFPIDQLVFTSYSDLNSFRRIEGSPILRFSQ